MPSGRIEWINKKQLTETENETYDDFFHIKRLKGVKKEKKQDTVMLSNREKGIDGKINKIRT